MDVLKKAAAILGQVRNNKPLIHQITNYVVANETANLTLCFGALPVMAQAAEEVEEMVAYAGALLLNIGTLNPLLIDAMILAGKKANELDIPIILDPVGAGATSLRTESAKRIMYDLKVSVIKGNSAEISILAGKGGRIAGVEALEAAGDIKETAERFARESGSIIVTTGREDIVTDGNRTALVRNGHEMMATITGSGCMSAVAVSVFCAVEKDIWLASLGAMAAFGIAGENAAREYEGRPGMFHQAIYDEIYKLTTDEIVNKGMVSCET